VIVARALHELTQSMGLPAYPKTSGATGLHVLIPLGGQFTYEQSRTLAQLLATVLCSRLPEVATTVRSVGDRGGRVYVDFLQNGHGRLLVAPLSVRPRPGATVSTPLVWDEVTLELDPVRFTISNVPERFQRLGGDPLRPVLEDKPDLPAAIARLEGVVRE
jgi:bifunctional non-homologous end joining protein LigD